VADRDELAPIFLRFVSGPSSVAVTGELESELRVRWDAARAAWPDITLAAEPFLQFLAERATGGLPPRDRAGDLYIACACSLGIPSALDAFRRRYRGVVARAIRRTDSSEVFLEEVLQELAIKFFVRARNGGPGVAQYRGRSTLRAWLATAAARTAINMRRAKAEQEHEEVGSGIAALEARVNPELLLLKARYKPEFESSIRAALAAMTAEERTLLLLQIVDGLTLPQLASMRGVSRATIARRLAEARDALFEQTRRQLADRLRLSPSEYASVLSLLRSQLEVSLTDVLRSGWKA
jgi:RNA polymerase sigma-70 factor (ECF subfamily)